MRRPVPRRKIVTGIALVAGSVAGAVVFRRRSTRRRDRVDVYFEDGSMITYDNGSPEAAELLPIARDALDAVSRR